MDADIYPPQAVARVKHVSEDQTTAFLELRNGSIATCTTSEEFRFERGDIVFIDVEHNDITLAPDELWDEEPWVGVVRLLSPGQVGRGSSSGRLPAALSHCLIRQCQNQSRIREARDI
ncbi:hypothetical protein [Streptomyces sp. NPDC023838]|uniref:hypothetical protein n=1 Tax=Streptomyces sp. NPDC023838 TaxID=3154325 RepID=UPI0033D724BD